jgi:hypothetical protein
MKKETLELIDLIKDFKNGSISYDKKPFDSNHWFRSVFRLYIDGSHSYPRNEPGYKYVERLRQRVIEANDNEKKLTSIAIENFMNMLEVEYPELSRSTLQKTIVKNFSRDDLSKLNKSLVEDLKEAYQSEEI